MRRNRKVIPKVTPNIIPITPKTKIQQIGPGSSCNPVLTIVSGIRTDKHRENIFVVIIT